MPFDWKYPSDQVYPSLLDYTIRIEPHTPNHTPNPVLPMIKENRIGIFHVDDSSLHTLEQNNLLGVMGNMLIIEAEYQYSYRRFEYVAYSPLFDSIGKNEKLPVYQIMIMDDGDVYVKTGDQSWRK